MKQQELFTTTLKDLENITHSKPPSRLLVVTQVKLIQLQAEEIKRLKSELAELKTYLNNAR